MAAESALAPGGTLGILGGGQLGRMLAMAAARLGIRCHVYCPDKGSPAFDVASVHTLAAYDDEDALARFADAVDRITYEFENVPAATAEFLAARKPVHPKPSALAVAQDRFSEKSFIHGLGIGTARFANAESAADIAAGWPHVGAPAILKTRRMGYDGKGQAKVASPAEAEDAFVRFGGVPCVLESFEKFDREISVVAARAEDGTIAAYDAVENIHENHILARTLAPARLSATQAQAAAEIAARLLAALDYVGVIGVEMFAFDDGRLLVNEIAPRVHNSGHWTLDACATSQFEQHVRTVCGWPLGAPDRHSDAVMENLIGKAALPWQALAAGGGCLHLYGKREARPGRKMGHVTHLYPLGQRP